MKSKKSFPIWIVAGIYFLTFLLFSNLFGILFQMLSFGLVASLLEYQSYSVQNWILLGAILISYAIYIIAIFLAAKITKRYFSIKGVKWTITWAIIYNIILDCLFFGLRLLTSNVNGMHIIHDYQQEIASSFLHLIILYLFSIQFLKGTTLVPRIKMIYTKQLRPWLP